MRANRGRDTKPELAIRRELHRTGLRYRVDFRPVPGLRTRPDIVFTRAHLAIYIDGCFWHGCPQHHTKAKSNGAYWRQKIVDNAARDKRNTEALESAGWKVLRFWEHQTVDEVVSDVRRTLDELSAPGRSR